VRWKEVPSLYGHGPNERIYSTRIADDGTVTIRFGDGLTGARLPTGEQNVHAVYRKGIGLEGLVRTDQLSLLMDRPYGVRGVTNPVPSRDADRPESREDARANAPLTVLTLDRIVSLRDFEDFSRAFTGIAKARASSVEGNDRHAVFITVAGPGGLPVDTVPLTEELSRFGDPFVSFVVRTYRRVFFRVSADVSIDADRIPEKVFAAIEATLRAKFSFDARTFGQPVTRGEIFAAIQSVPGVASLIAQLLDPAGNPVDRLSAALPAHSGDDGAEILLLDTSPVALRRVP
jgi:predicted phage baseplate assembly protein